MLNIAVFYGGDSCEKDISIITGVQCLGAFDKKKYRIFPIFLKDGEMLMPRRADKIATYIGGKKLHASEVWFDKNVLRYNNFARRKIAQIDCAVICLHGGAGENGSIQGMLNYLGVPYTSPSVLNSAIGMDKAISKTYFKSVGCKVLPYVYCSKFSVERGLKRAEKIGYPLIVKPNNQGSSIGISVAHNPLELENSVRIALEFDNYVIIEKALVDFYEINCACLRKDGEIIISSLEQPIGWTEFLSFDNKYMSSGKLNGGGRIYPAKLVENTASAIKTSAYKIFAGLDMSGIVRFDFLVERAENGENIYINEMNTVPGSLAFYLFEEEKLDYSSILEILIAEAIRNFKNTPKASFESNVLSACSLGGNACKRNGKIV